MIQNFARLLNSRKSLFYDVQSSFIGNHSCGQATIQRSNNILERAYKSIYHLLVIHDAINHLRDMLFEGMWQRYCIKHENLGRRYKSYYSLFPYDEILCIA